MACAALVVAGVVALCPAPQAEHPFAQLQRLEARAQAEPAAAGARYALGLLLADPFADPRAIDELRAAIAHGLAPPEAVHAHFWIGWVALWNGRDREALAAFQAVERSGPEGERYRGMAATQVASIRRSHEGLAGVESAEGRALALLALMTLGIIGAFWGGRRLAQRTLQGHDSPDVESDP